MQSGKYTVEEVIIYIDNLIFNKIIHFYVDRYTDKDTLNELY